MRWSLEQLMIAKRESFTFEKTVNLDDLKEMNKEIRHVSPIHVKGEAVYSDSILVFTLSIKGELILPCSRTLADAHLPIDLQVEERFHPANEYISERVAEEEDIHLFEGNIVDLTPYVKERIILEIPMQIFADDEAIRAAPLRGEGWEVVSEEEQKDKIDPRLADLAKFFNKK